MIQRQTEEQNASRFVFLTYPGRVECVTALMKEFGFDRFTLSLVSVESPSRPRIHSSGWHKPPYEELHVQDGIVRFSMGVACHIVNVQWSCTLSS